MFSFMKKLLLLLFSILMSFSSYAEWVEMAYDPEDNIWYVERDSVIEKDGYIYWTEMVNWIKPNSGYKSTQGERQGDCENNRSKTLSITHFKEAMGNGETEVNTKDNPKWQDESSGSVAEIILNNLCEYVESLRPKVEEESETVTYSCESDGSTLFRLYNQKPSRLNTGGFKQTFTINADRSSVWMHLDSTAYAGTVFDILDYYHDNNFTAFHPATKDVHSSLFFKDGYLFMNWMTNDYDDPQISVMVFKCSLME